MRLCEPPVLSGAAVAVAARPRFSASLHASIHLRRCRAAALPCSALPTCSSHPVPASPPSCRPVSPCARRLPNSPRAPPPSRTPPPLTSVASRACLVFVCAHHELRGRTSLRRCTIARAGRRELDSHGTLRSTALVSLSSVGRLRYLCLSFAFHAVVLIEAPHVSFLCDVSYANALAADGCCCVALLCALRAAAPCDAGCVFLV